MATKGVITQEQVFKEKVVQAPERYTKKLEKAIETTLEFIKVGKEMNEVYADLKVVKTSKEFLDLKERQIKLQKQEEELFKKQQKAKLDLLKEGERLEREKQKTQTQSKKDALDILKKELDLLKKLEAERKKVIKLSADDKLSNKQRNRALAEEAILNSDLVGAYQKLNLKRTQAKKTYLDLLANEKASNKELEIARKKFEKLDKKVRQADKAVGDFSKNVGNYQTGLRGLTSTLRNLAGAFGFTTGLALFGSLVRSAFDSIREFDKEMQIMAGIARVSRGDLKDLEENILNVAGSSVKTSNEVAKLASSLFTLGKTKDEIKLLLKPANDLSIGLQATSEEAGEFLIQMLNAFGASADEAQKYADTLASIRTSTTLDFQKMRDSFQYITPISRILNKDLAYTGAVVGVLADNSLKAESAGRLLATAQIKLATQGKTLLDAMLEINNAQKEGKDSLEILSIAEDLFGKQAAKVGVILGTNIETIQEYEDKINSSQGALDDLVNEQLKSLDSSLLILKSRWEEFILKENDAAGASSKLSKAVNFLSENLDLVISAVTGAVKGFLIYKGVLFISKTITTGYSLATTGLALAKKVLSTNTKKATIELAAFRAVLASSGIGIAIVLISTLASTFIALKDSEEEATESMDDFFESTKKLKRNIQEIEDLADKHNHLSKKTNRSTEEQKELEKITAKIGETVPDATTKVNEYGEALEINTEKTREYIKEQQEILKKDIENKLEEKANKLREINSKINNFDSGNKVEIEEIGQVKKTTEGLVRVISNGRNGAKEKTIKLTEKQALVTRKFVNELRKETIETEKNIAALDGTTDALNKAKEEKLKDSLIGQISILNKLADKEELRAKSSEGLTVILDNLRRKNRELTEEEEKLLLSFKKSSFDLRKEQIQDEIKSKELILDNEKTSYQESLKASTVLANKQIELSKLKYNEEIRLLKLANKEGKINDDELHVRATVAKLRQEARNEEYEKSNTTNLEKVLKERIAFLTKNIKEAEKVNDANLEIELAKQKKLYDDKKISYEEYQNEVLDVKKQYALADLELQRKAAQDILNSELHTEEEKAAIRKVFADLDKQIRGAEVEDEINADKKISDARKQYLSDASNHLANMLGADAAAINSLLTGITQGFESESQKWAASVAVVGDILGNVFQIGSEMSQRRIDEIDYEIDKSNEYYDDRLENESLSDEQRESLEARREAKEEELEKKKAKEKNKQAKIQKAATLTNIATQTAVGVISALAQAPKFDGGISAAILAKTIGTIGALQFAFAAAQPLPKYAKGVKSKPTTGLALVGEERPEVIIEPNKDPYIVDSPSILSLRQGTEVVPSLEEYQKRFDQDKLQGLTRQLNLVHKAERMTAKDNSVNEVVIANAVAKELSRHAGRVENEVKRAMKNIKVNAIVAGEKSKKTIFKRSFNV